MRKKSINNIKNKKEMKIVTKNDFVILYQEREEKVVY